MDMQVVRLGVMDYGEALCIQQKMLKLCQQELIPDTLLLVEHLPVITLGKRAAKENILVDKTFLNAQGITIYEIDRGGDVTYHGPGQIVGYPIVNLNHFGRDIRTFVGNIEEIFIRLLSENFDITARKDTVHTGVWVDDEKITAIGIAVKRWVTMHGFAFNVNTCMDHFKWIVPCGIRDKGVTSVQQLTGNTQDIDEMTTDVIRYFGEIFDVKLQTIEKNDFFTTVQNTWEEQEGK